MNKGLMIVISGPAGSGKGTVNAKLLESGEYVYSVSATTRQPRPGEINGKNYHFITREDFEGRIQKGEMLEYTSLSVEEIAETVGYADCSYFCRVFKRFTGHTPLFYRK